MAFRLVTVAVVIDVARRLGLRLRTQLNRVLGSEDEAGCGLDCAVFCGATACDTADAEETGLIILVLTPAFCIGPFAGKFELMNISSSSGSSGVIFPRYKRNDEPSSGSSVAQMNESSLTKVHRSRLLIQVNPCIPTNVTPKTATPDQNGPSPNGHLRLCKQTQIETGNG